jgi:nucleotide-binding universal stress UspA family protein
MELKQMVVATDGSPSSRAAVELALELAAARGARVVFLHANRQLADRLFAENPDQVPTQEQLAGADPVLREASDLAATVGVQAQLELIGDEGTDSLAPEILGVADAYSADLIVVGSRARRPMASAILGSTSLDVLREASVLTLVAHAPHMD